ncbi:hypothetical protein GGI35DRAFT_159783 [Trichoderma velutinum]
MAYSYSVSRLSPSSPCLALPWTGKLDFQHPSSNFCAGLQGWHSSVFCCSHDATACPPKTPLTFCSRSCCYYLPWTWERLANNACCGCGQLPSVTHSLPLFPSSLIAIAWHSCRTSTGCDVFSAGQWHHGRHPAVRQPGHSPVQVAANHQSQVPQMPLLAHTLPPPFRIRPELPLRLRPWRRDLIRVAVKHPGCKRSLWSRFQASINCGCRY